MEGNTRMELNPTESCSVLTPSGRNTPVQSVPVKTTNVPVSRPRQSLAQSVARQLTSVLVGRQNPVITNDTVDRRLVQHVSQIPWNEQRMVKRAFDSILTSRKQRKLSVDNVHSVRQSGLPSKLELRQVGRSVKYMKVQEREALSSEEKRRGEEVKVKQGMMSGEWEGEQRYLCTVCAAEYDDLQEVMHHKWESHPFCLVAHATYQNGEVVPPALCYPQVT